MSKAENFIQEHTRNCSNQYDLPECFENGIERLKEYQPWLSPDQARRAVEIEREEVIEKVCEYIASNMRCDGYTLQTKSKFINDLKQAMKDECI